ncbi:pseudouridine synthase [Micropruina sonneratiae]|uniref:pseudouridine synthase n=1 Tax=Micropruina sonneratiae TaxID=2986940 RepID=UPI002226E327|nr:pseudouridine synthase [Micropruina sp. KQZ13P-5]MCW3157959.1 rRNA pseudouridine synthase [Micropruina sp. KQZ13P-5]
MSDEEGIRLQKVLASAGLGSRRHCEQLIEDGLVEVNGRIVAEQGMRVDPRRDVIRVDGARIPPPRRHLYLAFHKPRGVVSTMDDPQGRTTIADFLGRRSREGLFHVGRLDTPTEGLLLITNDGEFAQRMAHPSHAVSKTYVAEVEGVIENVTLRRLGRGVKLEDGPVRPDAIKLIQRGGTRSIVQVVLHEGRNRIVRRMFESVGHPVRRLSRTAIGPVKLGQLPVGEMRELNGTELGALIDLAGL